MQRASSSWSRAIAFEPYPAGAHELQGLDPGRRGRAGRGPRRHARGPLVSRADHRLQVDGACGRGRRGSRPRLPTCARAGRRHRGRAVIPLAEIKAARDRLAGAVVRTPLVRLEVDAPCRALPEAREPPADRLVQAAWSGQRACAGLTRGAGARGLDGERGQHGAGCRLVGATARCSVHVRRPGHCAGDEAGRDQAPGVGDRPGLVRRVVGGLSDAGARRARRPVRARVQRRGGDGRQWDDRARSRRRPARRRRDRHPLRRRRADLRHRLGSPRAEPRSAGSSRPRSRPERHSPPRSRPAGRSESTTSPASSTESARPRSSRRCSS